VGLSDYLLALSDRCACGFHVATQGCHCDADEDWAVFTAALKTAARRSSDRLVHQREMRPLIRDRIKSQRIPGCYSKAIRAQLITEVSREQSNDRAGRNTNTLEPVYRLSESAH
jgi:hypothetical protein